MAVTGTYMSTYAYLAQKSIEAFRDHAIPGIVGVYKDLESRPEWIAEEKFRNSERNRPVRISMGTCLNWRRTRRKRDWYSIRLWLAYVRAH